MTGRQFSDQELDRLLALASKPDVPGGAMTRLMAAVAADTRPPVVPSNVVQFSRRSKQGFLQRFAWPSLVAMPLAASLACGIWLGAAGIGTDYLLLSSEDVLASVGVLDGVTGIEDAVSLVEDVKS